MLELLVLIFLVGMMAAMAIPSFNKAQQKTVERGIADNLDTIWQGVLTYKIRNNNAFPGSLADMTAINNTLGTYIIDNSATYNCVVGIRYDCSGTSTTYGWVLHVRERNYGERPVQSSGTPPSCFPTQCPWITYPYTVQY